MINIKRIRIDSDGIIAQLQNGFMKRIILEKDEIEELKRNPKTNLKKLTNKYDFLNQFFYEEELDAKLDIFEEQPGFLNRPLRIYYGVEPRCNLHCKFCGPRDFHNKNVKVNEEMEDFIIEQIAESGAFQIQLTGGEIGIRGYDLLKILEKVKKYKLGVILSTNGVWNCIENKDDFIEKLKEYDNIIQTKISIEGTPEFHDSMRGKGTYAETVDTLKKLSKYNLYPRISTTIFKNSCNKEQLEHLVMLALENNAGLQTIPIRPIGEAYKLSDQVPTKEELFEYSKYANELRAKYGVKLSFNFDIFEDTQKVPIFDINSPISCGAPLWGIHVTHTGEVYPCGFVQEADKEKTFLAGVISPEESLTDIWLNSNVFRKIKSDGKSEKCKSCNDYGKGCWGGCWVMSWITTKKTNNLDPYCYKDLYEECTR